MPEHVQVAFRVYATDWGMTRGHGSRQIDWLVDGQRLHKENVLFVIDQVIDIDYRRALEARYRVYDATAGFYFDDAARWHRFVGQWTPLHWISYNDFHPRHRVRNAILRAAGCQTWHYSHSVNLPHVYGRPNYQPWEELDYDHLVLWNEIDAAAFQGGRKHLLGPLFSSQVPRMVVAVFDSTWENYAPGLRDKFFADLYALLERRPGLIILYKPKLRPPPMPEIKNFYVLPEWIMPGVVIGCADFTLGLALTSPVVEARGAGRLAAWYNPETQSIEDLEQMITFDGYPAHDDPAQRFRELLLT